MNKEVAELTEYIWITYVLRDTYYMYYDTDRVIDTKKRKPWNTTKTKLSHSFINLATPLLFFSIFQTPASVFVSGASFS